MRSHKRDAGGTGLHSKVYGTGKIALALLALVLVGVMAAGALAETGPFSALAGLTGVTETTSTETATESSAETSTDVTSKESTVPASASSDPAPISGRYIVTFVPGTTDTAARATLAAHEATVESHISALRMYSVALIAVGADALAADPSVSRVEADRPRDAAGEPNDPDYAGQWALPRIGWEAARDAVTPTGSATVAILDTGVDASHPDLDGNLVAGTSILDGSDPTADPNGHGTQMAGIVAAETDNNEGIAGVGYAGVKVMPVTVLGADGTGQDSDIIEGVVWAADHGADVILMSFSNPGYSESLQAAIDYAWSQNVVLVGATGNGSSADPTFPAGDRGVVGVSSTDLTDSLSSTSNYGPASFLAAPGESVFSTTAGGGYAPVTGTSASAAIVAGSAALLRASSVGASNGVIVSRLARNAEPAGTPEQTGNGRVSLDRAITDTSSDSIQPAGAAPVGGGGPFVGPYTLSAANVSKLFADGQGAAGTETEVFSVGHTIYSNGTLDTGTFGRVVINDGNGVNRFTSTCQPEASFEVGAGNPNGPPRYTFQATDPVSTDTAHYYAYIVQQFTTLANCTAGTPTASTKTKDFRFAKATVYSDAALTTPKTDFAAGTTAYVKVEGFGDSENNVSTTWILPSGSTACANTSGSDRPDSSDVIHPTVPVLPDPADNSDGPPASDGLQYPPRVAVTGGDTWNRISEYEVAPCPPFSALNEGDWKLTLGAASTETTTFTLFKADATRPTVTINQASGQVDPTAVSPINYTVVFSEAVTGFTGSDVSFTGSTAGGTLSAAVTGSGTTYNVAVTGMTTRGTVVATISAGGAADPAGNGNTASTSTDNSVVWDRVPTATVAITPDPPTTNQTVTATATKSDPDGDATTVTFVWKVNGVTKRTFTSLSNTNATATDTFDLSVAGNGGKGDTISVEATPNDGDFNGATANDSATVANSAPTSAAESVSTAEDTAKTITLTGSDPDGDSLTFKVTSLPASGKLYDGTGTGGHLITAAEATTGYTVSDASGRVTFDPNANYNGSDSFQFKANDGIADSTPATVSITVTPVNDAPVAGDDDVSGTEDVDKSMTKASLLANDTDVDSGSLSLTAVSNASGGTVEISGADVIFHPAANLCGANVASFDYTVSDGSLTDTGTVTLDLECVNDAPHAVDDDVSGTEDTDKTMTKASLLANDTDIDSATLSLTAVSNASGGTVEISGSNVVFHPAANLCGLNVASFDYTVSDGSLTDTGTVTLDLTCVNDAPVAGDDDVSGTEDVDKSMTKASLLANDTDIDSATLSLTAVSNASGGTVEISGADVVFHPAANLCGLNVASFDYTVSDGSLTDTGTVTLDLTCVNDEPTLNEVADQTVDEDAVEQTVGLAGIGSGAANESQTLTVSASSSNPGLIADPTVAYTSPNATGTLKYTPAADQHGTATITVTVADNGGIANGGDDTKTRTFTVTVRSVNDAPTAVADAKTLAEDGQATIDAAGNDSAGPANESGQTLSVTGVGSPAHGTASVIASGADAGKILYTPAADYNGTDSFSYTVTDNGTTNGTDDPKSDTGTVSITITAVNDSPDAVNDSDSLAEDSATGTLVDVRANDSTGPANESGQTLTITAVTQGTHGSVAIEAGKVRYIQTDTDYNGTDSFTYTVRDNGTTNGADDFKSDTATVTITITAVNDAPVAVADSASTVEDTHVDVEVSANDTDVDNANSVLRVKAGSIADVSGGSATLLADGRTVRFSPAADANNGNTAEFSFTYRADDGQLASANAAKVTISVSAVNDAPVADDDSASTAEDTAVAKDVITNDSDVDNTNAQLSVKPGSLSATNGSASLDADGRTIEFTPAANLNDGNVGSAGFTVSYRATDGGLDSNLATLRISVSAVNDAPVADDDSASTAEDTAVAKDVITNDDDVDNTNAQLSVKPGSLSATNGSASLDADGRTIEFTPAANLNDGNVGSAGFTVSYRATDGALESNLATLRISVSAVNDAPVADDDSASTAEDTAVAKDVITNDDDVDNTNAQLSVKPGSLSATNGSASLDADGRTIEFTPAANLNDGNVGPAGFTVSYRATDGALDSNLATLRISVSAVNDAPVADDDSASTAEDTAVAKDVITNDDDVDNTNAQLSVKPGSLSATNGSASLDADGRTIEFTPAANLNDGNVGPAGFTVSYRATDGALDSNLATLRISVSAVNDAPVADDDDVSGTEDVDKSMTKASLLANDTDIDSATLSLTAVSNASGGTVEISGSNVVFHPAANLCGLNVASFDYTVSDGSLTDTGTVTLDLECVNDAPHAVDDDVSGTEDTDKTMTEASLLANDTDIDSATLSLTAVSNASGGTVEISGSNVVFHPAANLCGLNVASFDYTVSDGSLTDTGTVTLNLECVDDAPVAVDDADTVLEDAAATSINVLGNDTDIDGGPKTVSSVTQPANGTVVKADDGSSLTYKPNANYCNSGTGGSADTFTYKLNGGSEATVRMTVTCVDDAPVAVDDADTVLEDAAATSINVLGNDTDIDGGPKTVSSVTQPANGTVVKADDGSSLTYKPNANYCNSGTGGSADTFTYKLNGGSEATVRMTVTCVNDAPSFTKGANQTVNEDADAQTVSGWATGKSAGPSDESSQALTYSTSNTNNALFSTQPSVASDGTLTYTPAANKNGFATVTVTLTDNGGTANGGVNQSSQTFTITVSPVNDTPTASDSNSPSMAEDAAAITIDLRPLVDDLETADMNLTYSIVSGPSHGSLTPVAGTNGSFSYDSDANYNGGDSFTYKVTDRGDPDDCGAPGPTCAAKKDSEVKTVTITITAVNDAPVIDMQPAAVGVQNTRSDAAVYTDPITYTVSASDVDNTGAQLVFSASNLPANLTLTDNHDGTATVTGNVGVQAGTYNATITVKDPSNLSDTGTATANVTQESATMQYTGDTVGQTNANMTLQATVTADQDTTPGDITKMWIAFDIYGQASCPGTGTAGIVTTKYAQVADIGAAGDGIGTATTTFTTGQETTYCVVVRLVASNGGTTAYGGGTNQWYTAPSVTGTVITFYNNVGKFVTGGGWIPDPAGGGNGKGNFGFNARYNKNNQPQGQMVYVYRGTYNGVAANYVVKSNALTALSFTPTIVNGVESYPMKATLQGKANIQINRASDGASLWSEGNATFISTVTDTNANSGAGSDDYALTVTRSNSTQWKYVPPTKLGGGNVVIHIK